MYSPVKKTKELTNLEMEALNLINEDIMGPPVTDEQKYEELLASRKNRKAVSDLLRFSFFDFKF
jgi:hypothetical protein